VRLKGRSGDCREFELVALARLARGSPVVVLARLQRLRLRAWLSPRAWETGGACRELELVALARLVARFASGCACAPAAVALARLVGSVRLGDWRGIRETVGNWNWLRLRAWLPASPVVALARLVELARLGRSIRSRRIRPVIDRFWPMRRQCT
jgi:hypothetical protein